jgi:hypothetical protein
MTNEGLAGIPSMIRVGRRIHSRITTWVLNKSTRTFLTAIFVVIIFLYSGVFAVATIHMVCVINHSSNTHVQVCLIANDVCVWYGTYRYY